MDNIKGYTLLTEHTTVNDLIPATIMETIITFKPVSVRKVIDMDGYYGMSFLREWWECGSWWNVGGLNRTTEHIYLNITLADYLKMKTKV